MNTNMHPSDRVTIAYPSHLPSPAELGQLAGQRDNCQADLAANVESYNTVQATAHLLENIMISHVDDGMPTFSAGENNALDTLKWYLSFWSDVMHQEREELAVLNAILDGDTYRGFQVRWFCDNRQFGAETQLIPDNLKPVLLLGEEEVVFDTMHSVHDFVDAVLNHAMALTSQIRDDGSFDRG